jgi:hypothetical protein
MDFTTHTNEFDGSPSPRCECCGDHANSGACDRCLDADCDGMGVCKRPKLRVIRYAGKVLA